MSSRLKRKAKEDTYAEIDLLTYSSTLIGLEKQALSYRRDTADKDYPTEFYEQLINSDEHNLKLQAHAMSRDVLDLGQKLSHQYVKMERTYLNSWQTFMRGTSNAAENIASLLKDKRVKKDAASLYTALRALNASRFDSHALRMKISDTYSSLKN